MKKLLIACCAALALSGCAPGLLAGLGGQPPAPLAATTIDDRALEKGWQAFDLALDAINLLGDFGIIKPGTPTGKAVASGIRATNSAFATAERAAAAGSARGTVSFCSWTRSFDQSCMRCTRSGAVPVPVST